MTRVQPLTPGEPVDLDIELWPTSIVVPAGYRIALSCAAGLRVAEDDRRAAVELQERAAGAAARSCTTIRATGPRAIFDGHDHAASHGGHELVLLPIIP